MKTKLCIALLFYRLCIIAQPPAIEWQKTFGGSASDACTTASQPIEIIQTIDGGYITAGSTSSVDGDVSGVHGDFDYWVIKMSATGTLEWQKAYGGSEVDNLRCITQTNDGGYAITGYSISNNGDVEPQNYGLQAWTLKLSSLGEIEWQKSYGGNGNEEGDDIKQTTDGGYIMAASSYATDTAVIPDNHGGYDYWMVKLNNIGNIEWQKSFGGTNRDTAAAVQQTSDGGYVVVGTTFSNNGDVTGFHGDSDGWMIKLNSTGTLEWQRAYGGSDIDYFSTVLQTIDGGFIACGATASEDGDLTGTGNHTGNAWIVKTSSSGTIEWQHTYLALAIFSIMPTTDGGYVAAGKRGSNFYILRINNSGTVIWEKGIGGNGTEKAMGVQQTSDGGYIVSGDTDSISGTVTGNHGDYDIWVVKLASDALLTNSFEDNTFSIYPNPAKDVVNIDAATAVDKITINDMTGRKVFELNGNSKQINVQTLPNGVYLIQILSEGKISVRKFIKE